MAGSPGKNWEDVLLVRCCIVVNTTERAENLVYAVQSSCCYVLEHMTEQFVIHFSCCSALMDCVGCEKCRLWGKLQVLGLGTALKILFSVDGEYRQDQHVSFLYSFFIC